MKLFFSIKKKTTPIKILYPKNYVTYFKIPTKLINIFKNKSHKNSFIKKLKNIQISTTLILKITTKYTFIKNIIKLF